MPSLTIAIPQDGPLVNIAIGTSSARMQALRAAGASVPTPASCRGLVDTGASVSAIDRQIAQQLGLAPTGFTLIHTPSTGVQPHVAAQFDISLAIMMDNQHLHMLPVSFLVIESDLSTQGFGALIGRDVLALGLLMYHGHAGIMSLAF
ncbi:MAG TPA: aspartyl protease family protein [Pirellulales bacterium]|nr:aspartyl protease family protein [Pirellulales bacterium]